MRRRDEAPDVPRHRKRAPRRKEWALEVKSRPTRNWMPFPRWTVIQRYVRRADAVRARDARRSREIDQRLWYIRVRRRP